MMEMRRIARIGLDIPRISLGCVTFGREIDETQSFRILDYAFERGITLLDTAEAYGGGQAREYRKGLGLIDNNPIPAEMHSSEKIIGRWLRSNGLRKQVVLQTKVTRNFTRDHLSEALSASLDRLQTDYIDIYLFHNFDTSVPLEEAMAAMTGVVQAGTARVAGCSNFSFQQLQDAVRLSKQYSLAPLEVIQPVYNLVRRGIEEDILPLCREEGISAITYSPLGAGFLAGKYQHGGPVPAGTRFDVIPGHANEYFSDRNFATVERLRELSTRTGIRMVQLALGWVLKNLDVTATLIGARDESQIDNAVNAVASPLPIEITAEMDSWQDASSQLDR